ncbi:Membrane bound protein complex subunit mbxA [Staphylothermus marinus F1]|uniref:Membrane bound protein complex subunit mbxA n=1 Tax=Staphylothermus marinus (strain ATCC 43588 / DSM 3639 / JCM 9404 / F1) TaxID=399550 RepID=A3DKI0_STAMF|nr:Na+/H+ antiporter subunit E [Staphylothermus marinus]ABN69140.1 Membrane bound protein complex subunit mbxA [Staphylothermus marinus F1]
MRVLRIFVVALLAFITYIVFSGSISPYDIVSGIVVALVIAGFFSSFTIQNPLKVFDPRRWFWLIVYAIYYFFVAEVKSHLDVMYRIIHPRMPVNPGIVMVPYSVESDYAITSIANSITNTPGTVVVDIDPNNKHYYVHWINVKTTDPETARKMISSKFEYFSKKVFD